MQCPNCALYHPSRYERCVSCGTSLVADNELIQQQPPPVATQTSPGVRQAAPSQNAHQDRLASSGNGTGDHDESLSRKRSILPTWLGIALAAFILCASAGVTVFFLTKPPENQRLLAEGQRQLQLGQYAFALKSLSEAVKVKPDDPKALLSLARAYVGVDQVDKAWDCIMQAQQLHASVAEEPALASDLANYYHQHGQYQRAIDLLRPLAAANIPGKKAELADLSATWGDQALQDGDTKQAMRCWEAVRDLKDGSRYAEAESRLATIYQKVAEEMSRNGDDDEALKYYEKLNAMGGNATALERSADLYQKQGKLDLAIDQLRKAVKLTSDPVVLNHKLAAVMAARGKELLDNGDAESGYGYLQQAEALDPRTKAPPATMRNVHVELDGSGNAHLTGEVWNAGTDAVNALAVRAEVYDTKDGKTLWSKDYRLIDEFVAPLGSHESRPLEILSAVPTTNPANSELRVYMNGLLYRAYPLGKPGSTDNGLGHSGTTGSISGIGNIRPTLRPRIPAPSSANTIPPTAPDRVNERDTAPAPAPNITPTTTQTSAPAPGSSPEEKTLKDLE
jgi:tetratricopeptide (TPR) repeat protein